MSFDFLFLHAVECPNCLLKAILLFVLAIVLGLILGWIIWGRYQKKAQQMEAERDDYHKKFTELEKDHASLKYQHEELTKETDILRNRVRDLDADKAVLKAQLERLREQYEGETEDLTRIEGIGPKIAEALHQAGIRTYAHLAEASADHVRDILDKAPGNFKLANPETWAKQAAMARDGKWDELKAYQDEI